MLVCLVFPLDFVLNFGEVIIGIAERIVDLRRGEVRIGLANGLNCVSGMSALINEANRNAGSHNDGIAPADRAISLYITVLSFDRMRHIWFLRIVNCPHSTSQSRIVKPGGLSVWWWKKAEGGKAEVRIRGPMPESFSLRTINLQPRISPFIFSAAWVSALGYPVWLVGCRVVLERTSVPS